EAGRAGWVGGTAAAASGAGPASYMGLAIARGIIGAMNNTVALLVKAMLAAEAAAIILIGVAAMNYGVRSGGGVAKKAVGPVMSSSVVAVASSQDSGTKSGAVTAAAKKAGM